MKFNHKQKGLTLIEVLVSMLIVAISLSLSLIMLQAAIRYNESAANKNVALFEAQSIISKMRSNSSAADKYLVDSKSVNYQEISGFNRDCFNTSCTSDEVAERDIKEWIGNIISSLPDGHGKIELFSPNVYAVTVSWVQINADSKESDKSSPDAKKDALDNKIELYFSI